jgi:hypothetical protein
LKATKLFQQLSAVAMNFPWFRLLKPDIIYQVDEEGKRHRWVEMKSTIMSAQSDAFIQLECGQDRTHNLELVSWMKVAEEDEIVKKLLRILTEVEHNWVNLYKIYEIVNKSRKKELEWVTKKKIANFTQTGDIESAMGDDARHGVDQNDPPKEPMSLSEADALIMTLLQKWLQWKCEQQK